MTSDAGTDHPISLEVDGVVVRKRFEADTFAVPTISFEIRSDRDEPVEFRLIDTIPSHFPMDGVGFHPDFGSDHWTAYQNNRVVFQRQLDPGEEIKTVYGIRITDPSAGHDFLDTPDVSVTTENHATETTETDLGESLDETNVSDLVGEESSNLIREFIRGERSIIPGIDFTNQPEAHEQSIDDLDLDGDVIEGLTGDLDDEGSAPTVDSTASQEIDIGDGAHFDENVIPIFEEPDGERSTDPADAAADGTDDSVDDVREVQELKSDTTTEDTTSMNQSHEHHETEEQSDDRPDLVANALAAEIESGTIDDATLATIARAIGRGVPTSVQTQLQHLQARVGELEAYSDAFARFLDDEGTGQQIVETMRADIDEIRAEVGHLDGSLSSTANQVNATDDRVTTLVDDLESFESTLETITTRLETLADRHDEELDRLEAKLDALDADVTDDLDEVTDDLDEIATELDAVGDDVREILTWRNQLGAMFSGGTKDDDQ